MPNDVQKIFGTALFGVVSDLAKAKEEGKQLPGLLDKIAGVAFNAKNAGVDFAKEEAKNQVIKYLPWVGLGTAIVIIIVLISKK